MSLQANTMCEKCLGDGKLREENIPSIPSLPSAYENYLSTVF